MWRFWIEGKEVYATVRRFGPIMKFSIHHSGQIHTRTGRAAPLVMAPAVPVENGPWMNTLELRFLTSDDAIAPPPEELKKETDRACGIPVPPGHFLHLNVLVVRGIKAPVPLPQIPGNASANVANVAYARRAKCKKGFLFSCLKYPTRRSNK
jgi:hypothetical protein